MPASNIAHQDSPTAALLAFAEAVRREEEDPECGFAAMVVTVEQHRDDPRAWVAKALWGSSPCWVGEDGGLWWG